MVLTFPTQLSSSPRWSAAYLEEPTNPHDGTLGLQKSQQNPTESDLKCSLLASAVAYAHRSGLDSSFAYTGLILEEAWNVLGPRILPNTCFWEQMALSIACSYPQILLPPSVSETYDLSHTLKKKRRISLFQSSGYFDPTTSVARGIWVQQAKSAQQPLLPPIKAIMAIVGWVGQKGVL